MREMRPSAMVRNSTARRTSDFGTATGKELSRLKLPSMSNQGRQFLFAPIGETLAVCDGKAVKLFEWRTGKQIREFAPKLKNKIDGIRAFAISPDGKTLAIVCGERCEVNDTIRVWEIDSGRELEPFSGRGGTHAF